jgi:hypothetical protein
MVSYDAEAERHTLQLILMVPSICCPQFGLRPRTARFASLHPARYSGMRRLLLKTRPRAATLARFTASVNSPHLS